MVYAFESYRQLLEYTRFVVDNITTGELYTSNVVKEMIKNDIDFNAIEIQKKVCVSWYASAIKIFLQQFPSKVMYGSVM